MTEQEILERAAYALQRKQQLELEMRQVDHELRGLCRSYDAAARTVGFQPHHLRRSCEARGLL